MFRILTCIKAHMRNCAYLLAMQEILTAISNPTRRAALALVWNGGEHCVCELMARLDASQSRMSRHMKVLREARLVLDRRDAQWVRDRRNLDLAPNLAAVIDTALAAEAMSERQAA
jgi:ArsR family transcriptional regulator